MGKGAVTKAFFPSVRNRPQHKIHIFPEFVMMITGHGKLRSYLHRFGLIDNLICLCEVQQTTDHFIFQCNKLCNQRNEKIKQIKNTCGTWPLTNETLVNGYLQCFVKFIKSIDFRDLQ
jgi:predicted metalloenzyme YecM